MSLRRNAFITVMQTDPKPEGWVSTYLLSHFWGRVKTGKCVHCDLSQLRGSVQVCQTQFNHYPIFSRELSVRIASTNVRSKLAARRVFPCPMISMQSNGFATFSRRCYPLV